MKWLPNQVGAEPKKLALLAVLLIGAGGAYWYSSLPAGNPSASVSVAPPADSSAVPELKNLHAIDARAARNSQPVRTSSRVPGRASQDFRPSMKLPDDFDVSTVDPAIRWDLLKKVQEVPEAGGSRSLFEFGKAPEPPPPPVKPIKPLPQPPPAPPAPPAVVTKLGDPSKPPSAPIPLKYYGYAGKSRDRALFLDGDAATGEPYVASVDQVLKGRYKVIRIGLTSAVLEDTTNKDQQTLPLVEDVPQ